MSPNGESGLVERRRWARDPSPEPAPMPPGPAPIPQPEPPTPTPLPGPSPVPNPAPMRFRRSAVLAGAPRPSRERWQVGESVAPSFGRELAALQRLWVRTRSDSG